MYGYLIFDLDGTLTDPKVGILHCINHALESCGIQPLEFETGSLWVIGPPLRETFRRLAGKEAEDSQIERLVSAYREMYETTGMFENSLYPGIYSLLRALRSDDTRKMILATSKPTVYARRIVEHFALDDIFDLVVGSELDGRRSAKVELLMDVVQCFGISGNLRNCLMVGDREHDIKASKELGVDSVGVLYGYGSKQEITGAEPTYVVTSVEELGALLTSVS